MKLPLKKHTISALVAEKGAEMSEEYPDGQLCPYKDCTHDLAIPDDGWYFCGHCKELFFAEGSDSDYEDYHCYRLEEQKERFPLPPKIIPTAKDLGPSWATPEKS